jgi:hypothetical protein
LRQFLLEQQDGRNDPHSERFRILAQETYRHGMLILRRALNLFQALQRVDVQTLEQERAVWLQQRAQEGSTESLERSIGAHTRRLDRYHRGEEELRTLVAQLNELETALETTHLEVVDLVGQAVHDGPLTSAAASHLERAVEAARRVEQRLRGFGDADTRADERYLEV